MTDKDDYNVTTILSELRQVLDGNGDISEKTREKIIMTSIFGILRSVTDLRKGLERNPFFVVGNFIADHPKLSLFLVGVSVVAANLVFISGFRKPIISWLTGLPVDAIP